MKGVLIRWLISAVALYLTAVLSQWADSTLPEWVHLQIIVRGAVGALLAVVALAVVNALIRPLMVVLTLPLNCLTLGLFTVVINALLFWLVGSGFVPGFKVEGFLAALFGSIVMGIISGIANTFLASKESRR